MNNERLKEHTYYVKGMHCASCEILLEKRLLEFPNIKFVDASNKNGAIIIKYIKEKPGIKELNKIFKENNYIFYNNFKKEDSKKDGSILNIISISFVVIVLFFLFQRLGIVDLVNVTSSSSLISFFFLGIVAGLSSCMALVGGLILSLSKQWSEIYSKNNSFIEKVQPHLMFNFGRLISYAFFGAILGVVGSKLQFSLSFTSFLVIGVSILMIVLSLQMLGVKYFQRIQFTLPRFFTRYIANENNFKGRYMPFLLGFFTFFLPCGFTITVQGLALISGNFIQGALIMFIFALGTAPTLLLIGISSIKISEIPQFFSKFLKIAGILVLFFALYNINSQFAILGIPNLNNLTNYNNSEGNLPPIINGQQIIKMDAFSFKYEPNYFKVKAGIPVKWEITDVGASGCTNAVISRALFEGQIPLSRGETSIKIFTPQKAGIYAFSCWMGMVSGTIEVVN